jgi:hypothetical protein
LIKDCFYGTPVFIITTFGDYTGDLLSKCNKCEGPSCEKNSDDLKIFDQLIKKLGG